MNFLIAVRALSAQAATCNHPAPRPGSGAAQEQSDYYMTAKANFDQGEVIGHEESNESRDTWTAHHSHINVRQKSVVGKLGWERIVMQSE
jgi:hypothetical protein